jgi:hypothetical protein
MVRSHRIVSCPLPKHQPLIPSQNLVLLAGLASATPALVARNNPTYGQVKLFTTVGCMETTAVPNTFVTKDIEVNRCYDADETTIAGGVFASLRAYPAYPYTAALPPGLMCEIKAYWYAECTGDAATTDNYQYDKCVDVDHDPENKLGSPLKRVAKSIRWECCPQDMAAKADGKTQCIYPIPA